MKVINRVPWRRFDGVASGRIKDGDGIGVRMSAGLTLDRDSDGSWLVFASTGPGDEDYSESLTVNDAKACEAFDALFELLADPVEFRERKIGDDQVQEVA